MWIFEAESRFFLSFCIDHFFVKLRAYDGDIIFRSPILAYCFT